MLGLLERVEAPAETVKVTGLRSGCHARRRVVTVRKSPPRRVSPLRALSSVGYVMEGLESEMI